MKNARTTHVEKPIRFKTVSIRNSMLLSFLAGQADQLTARMRKGSAYKWNIPAIGLSFSESFWENGPWYWNCLCLLCHTEVERYVLFGHCGPVGPIPCVFDVIWKNLYIGSLVYNTPNAQVILHSCVGAYQQAEAFCTAARCHQSLQRVLPPKKNHQVGCGLQMPTGRSKDQ